MLKLYWWTPAKFKTQFYPPISGFRFHYKRSSPGEKLRYKNDVISEWNDLKRRFSMFEKYDNVLKFYHVTTSENMGRINSDGYILLQSERDWNAEPISNIEGLWTCITMYNCHLPTISPYGTRRIRFDPSIFKATQFTAFYEGTHYWTYKKEVAPRDGGKVNQYIRFILLENGCTEEINSCNECLPQVGLSREDNPFFFYHEGIWKSFRNTGYYSLWIEIFVILKEKKLDLKLVSQDSVKETSNALSRSNRGLNPDLIRKTNEKIEREKTMILQQK